MNVFSLRLRWLREKKLLSQKEMSEALGVSQQYYNKFEKGTGEPNLEVLYKIRFVLDEELDFLLGASDIDKGSKRLQYFYFWLRQDYEKVENRINIATDLLKQVSEINSELRIVRLIELKENLQTIEQSIKLAFENLVSSLMNIPRVNPHLLVEEGWDERYKIYSEDQSQTARQYMYLYPPPPKRD